MIDAKGTIAGILGSNNTLQARVKGTVGFVIDGVCRDSYEATIQGTPVFCTVRSPAHPMGRIRAVSDGEPIVCAGVEVRQGDLVVGDDDGVVVVPQDIVAEVVDRAVKIQGGRPPEPSRRLREARAPARRDRRLIRARAASLPRLQWLRFLAMERVLPEPRSRA